MRSSISKVSESSCGLSYSDHGGIGVLVGVVFHRLLGLFRHTKSDVMGQSKAGGFNINGCCG